MSLQDTDASAAETDATTETDGTTETDSTTETKRPTPRVRKPHAPSLFGYGLTFALVAALLAFLPLTTLTLQQLFSTEQGGGLQPQTDESLPIPRGLSWSGFTYGLILRLGALPSPLVLAILVFLGSILVYGVLRILNPSFRLTTGVDWDETLLTKTYVHTPPMIKAFLIAIAAALPLFLIWEALTFLLGESAISLWLRMGILGFALLFLFSPDGVAGDLDSGNYLLPRDRRVLLSLLVRGVLMGTAMWAMVRFAPTVTDILLFRFYRSLGGIGEMQWLEIAALGMGPCAAAGFVGAGIAIALGTPNRSLQKRARLLVPMAVALFLVLHFNTVWLPQTLENRYDFVIEQKPPVNPTSDAQRLAPQIQRLAQLSGVPLTASGAETILLIAPYQTRAPEQVLPINIAVQSYLGPDAGPDAAAKVEAFLRKRGYATALQEVAYRVLHDAASLTWDPAESLRIDFEALNHARDPVYLPVLLEKLQVCQSTPETRRYVDMLADSRYFVLSDREALRLMGDLYAHFGDREEAKKWYRKADLPATRIEERLAEKTMFAEGKLTGRLLLNGKPVGNARIGVVPATTRPGFLTGFSPAMRELPAMEMKPGFFRPYWLRWLSASTTTDPNGRFTLDHLTAAHYRFLVQIPGLQERTFSENFTVKDLPEDVFVGFGRPQLDMGDLKLLRRTEKTPETRVSGLPPGSGG